MTEKAYQQVEIPNCLEKARAVENQMVRQAVAHGYSEEDIFALRLSLEEALTNAVRHGNCSQADMNVVIRYHIDENEIEVYIRDDGKGFDPAAVPDPTLDENIQNPSGRGIMLMRAYMTHVEYNDKGNEVHMVKVKSEPSLDD